MKLVSSFIDETNMAPGEINTICFQTTHLQQLFKEYLVHFMNRKNKSETNYVHIVDEDGEVINIRNYECIYFDCSSISLSNEKETRQTIQKMLFYQLENNPRIVETYFNLRKELDVFFNNITLNFDEINIEFELTDKSIESLVKQLDINIGHINSYRGHIPNYELRHALLQMILGMSVTNDVILFITFPENDLGINDYVKFFNHLKNLNITTILLTTNKNFIMNTEVENITMYMEQGRIYDIIGLKKELLAFNLCDQHQSDNLAKSLAFDDFSHDIQTIRRDLRTFLESSTF